jgi:hypothetical protein
LKEIDFMSECIKFYEPSKILESILFGIIENKSRDEILESISTFDAMFDSLDLIREDSTRPCMNCKSCHDFSFYLRTFMEVKNGCSKEYLGNQLHHWKEFQLVDEALTFIMKESITENDFKAIPVSITGIKVYFDQNILSDYAKNEDIKNKILELKGDISFFYSPSHLEETHKIPVEKDKNLVIQALSELTENTVILPVPKNDKNQFFKEDPTVGLNRIKKFDGSTSALESRKLLLSKDREMYLKKYETEKHKKK